MREEFTTQVSYGDHNVRWDRHDGFDGTLGVIGTILLVALVIAWGLFWLWMLINLLMRKGMEGINKLIWLIVILFVNPIGVLLYFFIIYRPERKAMATSAPTPSSTPSAPTSGTQQ